MDYYQFAWQLYLVLAGFISVFVFLIIRPFSLRLRSVLQALAMAILFVPVTVVVDGVSSSAPLVAKLVVDVIAGKLLMEEFAMPLVIFLLAFVCLTAVFYSSFVYFIRDKAVSE